MDVGANEKLGELLVELANGNISALSGIAESVEETLKAMGNIYYRNQADVEDAVHDLYVKLPQKALRFKKNTNAKGWIIRVFENSIRSNLRTRKREREMIQEEISYLKASANIADEQYLEKHLFLREILGRLSLEEKRIFIYYYWGEYTVREIAKIIRRPKLVSQMENQIKTEMK